MSSYWGLLARRTNRRRVIGTTGGAVLAASLLAACGSGSKSSPQASGGPKDASGLLTAPVDTTSQAKKGGILKRSGTGEGSLDPNLSVATVSGYLESTQARLVTWKVGHMAPSQEDELAPDAAES